MGAVSGLEGEEVEEVGLAGLPARGGEEPGRKGLRLGQGREGPAGHIVEEVGSGDTPN